MGLGLEAEGRCDGDVEFYKSFFDLWRYDTYL